MKKLLILLLVFSTIQVDAQWYTKQFGVTDINELNKEQLNIAFNKANSTKKTGKVITIIGITTTVVGGAMFYRGAITDITTPGDEGAGLALAGEIIVCGGVLITGIGIPVWIVGASRKKIITFHLDKFNETSYIPSIGIRISF